MLSKVAPGATVAVVAPASAAPAESFAAGLNLLQQHYQVDVRYAEDSQRSLPYLAAEDDARLQALEDALADPQIEAIFCVRGGYGCLRIVDRLDAELWKQHAKPLIGFSDITVLHAWAATQGIATVHGPVVNQLAALPTANLTALVDLLAGKFPRFDGLRALAPGDARGPLWGGNLAMLAALCGSDLAPPAGSILLLEDVGEAPYRLDRLLTQLRRSGAFERVSGVVLGDFVRCDQADPAITALDVIRERLQDLALPIVAGLPVGHGDRNVALPLGLPCKLSAAAGTLSWAD